MTGPIKRADGERPVKRQCTAHKRDGSRCRLSAVRGAVVCHKHGASAGQVRRAAAARVAKAEAMVVLERYSQNGDGPVDVAAALEWLVKRMTGFADFATARLEALTGEEWAEFSPRTMAEVVMFQAACRDLGRLLTDRAALVVLERMVEARARINKADALLLKAAVDSALVELGHDPRSPHVKAIVDASFVRLLADRDDG
jgi:hypothetical protein